MDTLQNMRAFVCVAETGSFTAASQQLNTTTAYVSRAVANAMSQKWRRLCRMNMMSPTYSITTLH